jgi:hypothetical protein
LLFSVHELGHGLSLMACGGDKGFMIGRRFCSPLLGKYSHLSPEIRIAFMVGGNAGELAMAFGGYDPLRRHASALGVNFGFAHFTIGGTDHRELSKAGQELLDAGWSRRRLAAFVSREKLIAALLAYLATQCGLLNEVCDHFLASDEILDAGEEDFARVLAADTSNQLQEARAWQSDILQN